LKSLLVVALLAFGVGVAYLIPGDGAPAVILCAAAALLAAMLIGRTCEDDLIMRVFVAALLFRLIIATIIYVFEMHEYFGGDALTYDEVGYMILQSWRGHIRADAYRQFVAPRLDTNWGMSYLTAVIYTLTGRNMLAPQFFNSVVGAATAPVIYRCAHHIFGNLRVARLSLLFMAFWPSLALWSAQGLKDGPIMFLLALAFLITLKLADRLRVSYCLLLACTLLCLLSLRFYIFYIVVASIVCSHVLGLGASASKKTLRQFASVAILAGALVFTGISRTADTQIETFGSLEMLQRSRADQAHFNSGYGKDLDVSTTAGVLGIVPLGTAYLLFAPFPWQLSNLRQTITLPEMLAWWGCIPILLIGLRYAVRFKLRRSLPILLFTTMLTLAYAIFQANVGTAYRQRSQLLEFYFIFISVGFVLLREGRENREYLRLVEALRLKDRARLLRRSKPKKGARPAPDRAVAAAPEMALLRQTVTRGDSE
jgi:4-amino-4-deoxy-L-arabinose transferase-like glycosyltransferase